MATKIQQAIEVLQQGGIIAYPTEAVFGLGCDPLNEKAVMRLLNLKQRSVEQGLILIAATLEQLQPWIDEVTPEQFNKAIKTWPGPYTWIFPAKKTVPFWLRGKHKGIAVRITDHPIAKELCEQFGAAIVSTSANPHGQAPAMTGSEVRNYFSLEINYIVEGSLGESARPTEIRDVVSGKIIRK
jgi:L-threonylcarbamoyladenylate synthase